MTTGRCSWGEGPSSGRTRAACATFRAPTNITIVALPYDSDGNVTLVDGKAKYVTALGTTDTPGGLSKTRQGPLHIA